jgi:hypothetical protein
VIVTTAFSPALFPSPASMDSATFYAVAVGGSG